MFIYSIENVSIREITHHHTALCSQQNICSLISCVCSMTRGIKGCGAAASLPAAPGSLWRSRLQDAPGGPCFPGCSVPSSDTAMSSLDSAPVKGVGPRPRPKCGHGAAAGSLRVNCRTSFLFIFFLCQHPSNIDNIITFNLIVPIWT